MLHIDALAGIADLARSTEGAILEVGAYVGGSTIAACLGMRGRARRFLTLEAGGSYPGHEDLPTDDILRDLRKNLRRFRCDEDVEIVAAHSRDPRTYRDIARRLGDERIGLCILDSDGNIDEDLARIAPLMHDDCRLVIDDYSAPLAPEKAGLVRALVDELVATRTLVTSKLAGYGTWFGHVGGASARRALCARLPVRVFRHEAGHCYLARLDWIDPCPELTTTNDSTHPQRSALVLWEDDRPLTKAHALHASIRERGEGAYSHWMLAGSPYLHFSTSDNSDPNTNGHRYELRDREGRLVADLRKAAVGEVTPMAIAADA